MEENLKFHLDSFSRQSRSESRNQTGLVKQKHNKVGYKKIVTLMKG